MSTTAAGEARARQGLRVAVVAACPFPLPRGTPVRIHRLTEALARRGHRMHVVTYHLGNRLDDPPFEIHRTPSWSGYRRLEAGPSYWKLLLMDPLLARELGRVLRAYPVDLIHAHHYEGLLVALAVRRQGQPVVYDAHTLLRSELPFYGMGLPRGVKVRLGGFLDRVLPGRADHVVAVTETIRDRLIGCGALEAGQISVVPNGVEAELFDRAASRSAHEQTDERILVFAGSLGRYQRIDLLLEAFACLRSRRKDVRLRIVSEAGFEPYDELARRLGIRDAIDLAVAGFKELPSHLARADVLLNPRTDCDGIPQKLLNYMAAGRPIVSFAGSAGILEHGRTAWVVETANVAAFARAILRILDDSALASRLGATARQHVLGSYSWELTAQRVEEIYRRLLGGA